MLQLTREIRIEWGHCDPARIVYNPNYYHWMEGGLLDLFLVAGSDMAPIMKNDENFRGTPLVRGDAVFKAPARLGDLIVHHIAISRWGSTSFDVAHHFTLGDTTLLEASQTRVWARAHPEDPNGIIAVEIPENVRTALSQDISIHQSLHQETLHKPV